VTLVGSAVGDDSVGAGIGVVVATVGVGAGCGVLGCVGDAAMIRQMTIATAATASDGTTQPRFGSSSITAARAEATGRLPSSFFAAPFLAALFLASSFLASSFLASSFAFEEGLAALSFAFASSVVGLSESLFADEVGGADFPTGGGFFESLFFRSSGT
jgi:hypothetical protein